MCSYSPVVNNSWSLPTVKGLWVHDILKLIHSLCGIVHMSSQVTVKKAECVAIERQADRDASFVTLGDKQKRNAQRTCSVKLHAGIHLAFMSFESSNNAPTTTTETEETTQKRKTAFMSYLRKGKQMSNIYFCFDQTQCLWLQIALKEELRQYQTFYFFRCCWVLLHTWKKLVKPLIRSCVKSSFL